jgi:ABC-type glycerol-3-phosphate transport system permease component
MAQWDQMFPLGDPPDYEPPADASIAARAEREDRSPEEVALDLLLEQDGEALIFAPLASYVDRDHEVIRELITHPGTVLGLSDTWAAMIFINAAFNLSFAVWIMHSFFAGIPKEIDEAAQIDGAGRFTVLFKINLPLVWPGIVTAIVFTFVACWNEFAASLVILSTDKNQPLSVALTKFVGQYETSWQYVFGVSIVAILPVVILFMLIEKRLVGGLTAGSVK